MRRLYKRVPCSLMKIYPGILLRGKLRSLNHEIPARLSQLENILKLFGFQRFIVSMISSTYLINLIIISVQYNTHVLVVLYIGIAT